MGTAANQIATIADCQALDSTSFTTSTTTTQCVYPVLLGQQTNKFVTNGTTYEGYQLVKYQDIIALNQQITVETEGWGRSGIDYGLGSSNTSSKGYPLYAIYGTRLYSGKYFNVFINLYNSSNNTKLASGQSVSLYYNTNATTYQGVTGSLLNIGGRTITAEITFGFADSQVLLNTIGMSTGSLGEVKLKKTITIPVFVNGTQYNCTVTHISKNTLSGSYVSNTNYNFEFETYSEKETITIPAQQGPNSTFKFSIGIPTCVWTSHLDSPGGGGTGGSGSYAGTAAIWEDLEGE